SSPPSRASWPTTTSRGASPSSRTRWKRSRRTSPRGRSSGDSDAMGMSSAAGGRRRLGGMNEINVTPLIDVMLVLLVIFMVTAPLLTTGVHVDLPKVKSAPMQLDDAKLLVIITADEHVYLGKDEITQ